MGNIISIMNAKGGVGKSTTAMMLAETLATGEEKKYRILVVDADPQASLSAMMLGEDRSKALQAQENTLADLVREVTAAGGYRKAPDVRKFITSGASDVRGVTSVDIIVGNIELAWIERTQQALHDMSAFAFLREIAGYYDFVLIDCSPSITTFTERWLRSADHNIVPMRPDFLSRAGFDLICRVRHQAYDDQSDFASHLGVVINMKRPLAADTEWTERLKSYRNLNCFDTVIDTGTKMQSAAEFDDHRRTFKDKYDKFAKPCRDFADEVLRRIRR